MPRLDLVCQAVHDPAFLAQGPEALDVQADVAPTAAGLREVQDDAPDAAENGLAAIGQAPVGPGRPTEASSTRAAPGR